MGGARPKTGIAYYYETDYETCNPLILAGQDGVSELTRSGTP